MWFGLGIVLFVSGDRTFVSSIGRFKRGRGEGVLLF